MYEPLRQYDALLADIKRQISRLKTDVSPWDALEMGNEIQSHLNRVMADVAELVPDPDDYKEANEKWAGTVYYNHDLD